MKISLVVNNKNIVLNTYVQKVFISVILTLVKTLKGVGKKVKSIEIRITE